MSPAGYLFYPFPSSSLYENFSSLLFPVSGTESDRNVENHRLRIWPWIMWLLWKKRNDLVYSAIDSSPTNLLNLASEDTEEWFQVTTSQNSGTPPSRPLNGVKKWKAPETNQLKCNVDGSWKADSSSSGIGWILRDHSSKVCHIGAKCYPHLVSPLETEASALSWAVKCVSNLGYTNVVFETDCQDVTKALTSPLDWPRLQGFTSDILEKCTRDKNFSFQFAHRTENVCADQIAKHITMCPVYFALLDVTLPLWLQHLVNADAFCLQTSV